MLRRFLFLALLLGSFNATYLQAANDDHDDPEEERGGCCKPGK